MSWFHSCSLVLPLDPHVKSSCLATALATLAPVFTPGSLTYSLGSSGEQTRLHDPMSSLWSGEAYTGGRFTSVVAASCDLVTQLRAVVGSSTEREFWMKSEGALLFRSTNGPPAWHGRWQLEDSGLYELITVRVDTMPGEPRELEVIFPVMGYPLTATRLEPNRVVDGDRVLAAENRTLLLSVIERLPAAIGIEHPRWWIDGEYRFDCPDDHAALESWVANQ